MLTSEKAALAKVT
jgi:hypothetical protein